LDKDKALSLNLTRDDFKNTMDGLNGYATIDGSLFKTRNNFYSFANAHSLLLSIRNLTQYEVMVIRNSNYYDDKGITNPMNDRNIETFEQVHFLSPDANEYLKRRSIFSAGINSKLQVRQLKPTKNPMLDHHSYHFMKDSIFPLLMGRLTS